MFSYNEMGSMVQKEAWVGPLDWADEQIKVIDDDDDEDDDDDDGHNNDDLDDADGWDP